jgi:uncharacterized membrane protein YhaH (DUF805 family)
MNLSAILFSFTGRLNRAPYWLAAIATNVVGVAITFFAIVIVLGLATGAAHWEPAMMGLAVLAVPALLGLILDKSGPGNQAVT